MTSVCLLTCRQIDILCRKLPPGGSVLVLKTVQEMLGDTFSLNHTLPELLKDTYFMQEINTRWLCPGLKDTAGSA